MEKLKGLSIIRFLLIKGLWVLLFSGILLLISVIIENVWEYNWLIGVLYAIAGICFVIAFLSVFFSLAFIWIFCLINSIIKVKIGWVILIFLIPISSLFYFYIYYNFGKYESQKEMKKEVGTKKESFIERLADLFSR